MGPSGGAAPQTQNQFSNIGSMGGAQGGGLGSLLGNPQFQQMLMSSLGGGVSPQKQAAMAAQGPRPPGQGGQFQDMRITSPGQSMTPNAGPPRAVAAPPPSMSMPATRPTGFSLPGVPQVQPLPPINFQQPQPLLPPGPWQPAGPTPPVGAPPPPNSRGPLPPGAPINANNAREIFQIQQRLQNLDQEGPGNALMLRRRLQALGG